MIASCGWAARNSIILECSVDMVEMLPRSSVLELKFVQMKSWVSDLVQFPGLGKCVASLSSIELSAGIVRSRSNHSLLFSSWGMLSVDMVEVEWFRDLVVKKSCFQFLL